MMPTSTIGLRKLAIVMFLAALAPPSALSESPKSPAAPVADKEKSSRVDRYGDPLPDGALFRFGSVRTRHTPTIRASALSPDGKFLATTWALGHPLGPGGRKTRAAFRHRSSLVLQ